MKTQKTTTTRTTKTFRPTTAWKKSAHAISRMDGMTPDAYAGMAQIVPMADAAGIRIVVAPPVPKSGLFGPIAGGYTLPGTKVVFKTLALATLAAVAAYTDDISYEC